MQAAVHLASVSEPTLLMEALDKPGSQDVLLLDRGHPAAWRVEVLVERRARFITHFDTHLFPAPDGAQQAPAELNGRNLLSAAA